MQLSVITDEIAPPGRGDHFDVHADFAAAIRADVPLPVDRDAYAALLADLRSGRVATVQGLL